MRGRLREQSGVGPSVGVVGDAMGAMVRMGSMGAAWCGGGCGWDPHFGWERRTAMGNLLEIGLSELILLVAAVKTRL